MDAPQVAGPVSVSMETVDPQTFETLYVQQPSSSSTTKVPSGTTHLVAEKGNTIYDSELQLLLDCVKKDKAKSVVDHPTFKHGSFLLYTQRGLLETMPLTYTCMSVSGNASVQEPNFHTIGHLPKEPNHSSAPMATLSKTSGYKFPSAASIKPSKQLSMSFDSSSLSRLPLPLIDILVFPKELMMQIDSMKSGASYSVVIKFPYPVALTDLSIPSASTMSSVSVEVWRGEDDEEGEGVRVAHSSEIKERSLMLGNLLPPPVCQFVKVLKHLVQLATYVTFEVAVREMFCDGYGT